MWVVYLGSLGRELIQYVAVGKMSKIFYATCKLIKSTSDKFYCKILLVTWIIWDFFIGEGESSKNDCLKSIVCF
jgi:hypothetical protein